MLTVIVDQFLYYISVAQKLELKEQENPLQEVDRRRAYDELDDHMRRSGYYDSVTLFPL